MYRRMKPISAEARMPSLKAWLTAVNVSVKYMAEWNFAANGSVAVTAVAGLAAVGNVKGWCVQMMIM